MDTKKLRQKILDLAIRGKLVPQDPNDEPTSVLLERIRAEKERLIKEGKIKRSKKSASDDEIEIPNGWVCCRFDEICSKFSTGPFGSMVHKSDYVSQNGTPIVNPMNIVDGEIVTNNLMMVSNEKAQELDRYRLSKDDILIARRGDLRKCCIVTEKSIDWLCGTGSFFLHVPFIEPRYIELFYLSEYVQTILKRECVGATMNNLNQSVLGSIPFLLPPLVEQKRIVNEVERWYAVIDALESNEGDLLKAIDKAKSIILDLAIHGKLVPQDPNDEPAIELLKRINPKFSHYDNERDPYLLPFNWQWCRLNDVCQIYGRIGFRGYTKEDLVPNNGAITLSPSNIIDGKMNYDNCTYISWEKYVESPEIQISEGDILLVKTGSSFGKCALVNELPQEATINPQFVVLKEINCNQKYLAFILQSQYARNNYDEFVLGTAIPTFTQVKLGNMDIPLPPTKEQLRIVAKIEELFAVLDSIKESLK